MLLLDNTSKINNATIMMEAEMLVGSNEHAKFMIAASTAVIPDR